MRVDRERERAERRFHWLCEKENMREYRAGKKELERGGLSLVCTLFTLFLSFFFLSFLLVSLARQASKAAAR